MFGWDFIFCGLSKSGVSETNCDLGGHSNLGTNAAEVDNEGLKLND